MRFPLQGIVHLETSHIPSNDRFAAQIVYATGPRPPIFRLTVYCLIPFISVLRFEMV